MKRLLFGLNVVLCGVLLFFVQRNARDAADQEAWTYGTAEVLPGKDIHVNPSGRRWRQEWVIDFGTDMVEESGTSEPPDGAVRLEPHVPVMVRWLSTRTLAVTPVRPLERARRYALHVDPQLKALDGRRVPDDLDLMIETDRLRLVALMVVEEGGDVRPRLMATFDLPVEAGTLRKALRVRSGGKVLPVEVEDASSPDEHALVIRLGGEGDPPRAVTVEVDGRLRARVGDLSMGRTVTREVVLREALRILRAQPGEHGIDLTFNRGVALPDDGLVTLRPAVPFQIVRRSSGLRILADLPAGQGVRVILASGFPGHGRARVEEPIERTVWVPDARPKLAFADGGRVLSSLARPELALRGVNVSRVEVSVRWVYPNNLVRLAQRGRQWSPSDGVSRTPRKREVTLGVPRNEPFLERVGLAGLLDGNARGVHEIRVKDLDGNAYEIRRVIQVTDLGVTVRATDGAIAVHVASLGKGIDVADATVEVLTPTNQLLCAGGTDARGVTVMEYERTTDDMRPYLVKVIKLRDLSYVDLDGFAVELATDAFGGRARASGVEAWLHADRGVVRPGGTLRVLGLVRGLDGAAPVDDVLDVTWKDPAGRPRSHSQVEVPGSGLLVLEHDTGEGAPTGTWSVELAAGGDVVGRTAVRVDAFVPERLEAEVVPVGDLVVGEEGSVQVRGRWLEGSPAKGLVAKVFVRFDHGRWSPGGFEGFRFDDHAKGAPAGTQTPITAVLDEEGCARVRFEVPADTGATQTLRARLSVELMDPSGRVVHAGLIRDALRRDVHLGIRAEKSGAVSLVAIDRRLEPVDVAEPVTLETQRRWWTWRPVARGRSWRYETEMQSEVIGTQMVRLVNGRADIRLELPDVSPSRIYGSWIGIVARLGDVVVSAQPGRSGMRPDRLRVTGPGAPVRAGQPFEVLVDSPMAGRAFVTVEGRRVHVARTATLARGRTRLVLQLDEDPKDPNVHVVVTARAPLARTSKGAAPFWVVGGTSVAIDRMERHADIAIDVPERVLPESPVDVKIHAPGATDAWVAVVDVGILGITDHADADPFGWFTARRRCTTRGADSGRALITTVRFDPGVIVGGDGGDGLLGPRLRGSTSSLIETLVLGKRVALDAGGRGTVRLKLPPYEGRVRVAVVAAGPRRMGAAARDVAVSGPIGLRVAMPRMLAPGDESRATITVRNGTGVDAEMKIVVSGFGGVKVGAAPTVLTMRDGELRTFDLHLQAEPTIAAHRAVRTGRREEGGALFSGVKIVASAAEHRREAVGKVVVRPPALWAAERIGIVADGRVEVTVPDGWLAGTRGRVVVHQDPDARLLPGFEALLQYPYGCVEQTTSRCRALLACARILPRLYGDGGRTPDAKGLLSAGINRLLAMQTRRGGLGWWPGARTDYPFGTVYALDLLLDAKASGFGVPAVPLARLVDRAWALLRTAEDTSLRIYGAAVLARAGRPVGPWLARLSEVVTRPEDRANAAMALALSGQVAQARKLLDEPIGATASGRESNGMLRSPLRARALELKARLSVTPTDPRVPKLAQELSDALLRPSRLTTQELGRSVDALASWFATRQDGPGFSDARVEVGGKTYALESGKPVEFDLAGGETLVVTCDGKLFGLLEIDGHRIGVAPSGDESVRLKRTIIDVNTGKEAESFRRGGVYDVLISGSTGETLDNVLFTDIVPGGFEVESKNLPSGHRNRDFIAIDRREARDDRVLLFHSGTLPNEFRLKYRMRATFPGSYQVPPLAIEALYEPGRRVEFATTGKVEVIK